MKYTGGLTVFAISLVAAVACELMSWFLIYRTAAYKSLTSSIDKTSKKVESIKGGGSSGSGASSGAGGGGGGGGSGGGAGSKSRNKKIDRFQRSLKDANQNLSVIKFQSGFVVAATLLGMLAYLNSLFDGKTVAKLPFVPPAFFQNITHRNLAGADPTDCSMVFIYMLCSVCLRPNLQKLLGFTPPRRSQPTPAQAASQFFGLQTETD